MSQLSEAWDVPSGAHGNWRQCPKYDIFINGCSKFFACVPCLQKATSNTINLEKPTRRNLYKSIQGVKRPLIMATFGGW